MTRNPFRPITLPGAPLCDCSLERLMQAALEGTDRPLCQMHDAAELAAQVVTATRDDAQADLDRRREARDGAKRELDDEHRAADDAKTEAAERTASRALRVVDPLLADVVDASGASNVTALNDPSLGRGLAVAVGGHLDDDTPTAA